MSTILADRNFVVQASRDRVWRLIGKVIFSTLPGMEQVEILDENSFRALLKMKLSGVGLTMRLKGEMVDVSPPQSFAVRLSIDGPGGLQMDQKVSIALTPLEKGKTAIAFKATAEKMGILMRSFFLGPARRFAQSTFEAIEKRLQELA